MKTFVLAVAASALLAPALAGAQSDGCRGALSALNRVKEEITPRLSASTPEGRNRLEVMESTLERGTNLCKDFAELWFYRMTVSERLGLAEKAAYAKRKLGEFPPQNLFDPFSLPPAAQSPPPPVQIANSKVKQKWALVVGIDRFEDKRVPTLRFSVKDSDDFARFLADPQGGRFDPAHIEHLANDKATLEGIREGLGRLRANAGPDDLVVLYLSSHGSPRDRDPNGVSYILTHDTNIEDAATLYATSLQMIDLVQELNREIRARRVVLILDTCFSGDATTGLDRSAAGARGFVMSTSAPTPEQPQAATFSGAFQNLTIGYGRAVITASRASELSWESDRLQNGYFTHFLLDALRASHGNENLESVFPQVRSAVSARVKADVGAQQNPSYEFSGGAGGIVIGAGTGQ